MQQIMGEDDPRAEHAWIAVSPVPSRSLDRGKNTATSVSVTVDLGS